MNEPNLMMQAKRTVQYRNPNPLQSITAKEEKRA